MNASDIVALVDVRLSVGGGALSPEAARIVATLSLMPIIDRLKRASETELEYAARIGTLDQIDRSAQYHGRYSSELLLKSDNHQWAKIRTLDRSLRRTKLICGTLTALFGMIAAAVTLFKLL